MKPGYDDCKCILHCILTLDHEQCPQKSRVIKNQQKSPQLPSYSLVLSLSPDLLLRPTKKNPITYSTRFTKLHWGYNNKPSEKKKTKWTGWVIVNGLNGVQFMEKLGE